MKNDTDIRMIDYISFNNISNDNTDTIMYYVSIITIWQFPAGARWWLSSFSTSSVYILWQVQYLLVR